MFKVQQNPAGNCTSTILFSTCNIKLLLEWKHWTLLPKTILDGEMDNFKTLYWVSPSFTITWPKAWFKQREFPQQCRTWNRLAHLALNTRSRNSRGEALPTRGAPSPRAEKATAHTSLTPCRGSISGRGAPSAHFSPCTSPFILHITGDKRAFLFPQIDFLFPLFSLNG